MKIPKNAIIINDVKCVKEYWNNKLTFQSKKSTDLDIVNKRGKLIFIPQEAKESTTTTNT